MNVLKRKWTNLPDAEPIKYEEAIKEHIGGMSRLNKLYNYYLNKTDILSRVRTPDLPNNKISYPYSAYITNLSAAYMLGEPVRYELPDNEAALAEMMDLYNAAEIDGVDMTAAIYQSIFGRSVILTYIGDDGYPKSSAIDPRSAFVIYDSTVQHKPICGIYLRGNQPMDPYTVYTEKEIIHFSARGKRGAKIEKNPFGNIMPMVEIVNNEVEQGDFETVISMIDAYNNLGSDRINDREQFSDALLLLRGICGLGETPEEEAAEFAKMRRNKVLAFPDPESNAEWVTKPSEGKDVEQLRASLEEDIHKLSQTPNFNDDSFGGTASGVAIRYKLFNFDNKTRMKERFFTQGLRQRARIYAAYMADVQGLTMEISSLKIRLTRRLPVDEKDRAAALKNLNGIISEEAIEDNSPFTEDNAS